MSDEINVNGNCHCGKIEIKAVIKKSEIRACHCTDCQTMSGAPLRAIAVAPADKIKITGNPKEYIKIGDSGNQRIQTFCPIVVLSFSPRTWREVRLISELVSWNKEIF